MLGVPLRPAQFTLALTDELFYQMRVHGDPHLVGLGSSRSFVLLLALGGGHDLRPVLLLTRFSCGPSGDEERAHRARHRLGFVER